MRLMRSLIPAAGVGCLMILLNTAVAAELDTFWVRLYDGPGNAEHDEAWGLDTDAAGNVYVTGWSRAGGVLKVDFATAKYSATGDLLWVRRYDGSPGGEDYARELRADAAGNVYVTGRSEYNINERPEYVTIKYNTDGDTLWVRHYRGPRDNAVALALDVDGAGNVYVTGWTLRTGRGDDYATVKYDGNGKMLWERFYDGPANGRDGAYDILVDEAGNVYVTGYSAGVGTDQDFATVKYSAAGDLLWARRYDGTGSDYDCAYAVDVDASGNVFVTGVSRGSDSHNDYATVKYSPLGEELWVRRYNGPANHRDQGRAVCADDAGNVYVTGWIQVNSLGNYDYATLKYGPDGDTLWVRRYDGPTSSADYGYAVLVDTAGYVYVTGMSMSSTNYDCATLKYDFDGNLIQELRYNGPGNGWDQGSKLHLDDAGNLLVAGRGHGSGDSPDFLTIKYFACTCPFQCDFNEDGLLAAQDIDEMIDVLFTGHADTRDGSCPVPRADFDCDGFSTALDLSGLVDYLYWGGRGPCDPCPK